MEIRIAGIVEESIVDGPGIRFTVFLQGCLHKCKGCHNPQTHALDGGVLTTTEEIIEKSQKFQGFCQGITFSGGEPFLQVEPLLEFAKIIKEKTDFDLVIYSGYTLEELMAMKQEKVKKLLEMADILIDGKYMENLRDLNLKFRGSCNQRVIDLKRSLEKGKVVLWCENEVYSKCLGK